MIYILCVSLVLLFVLVVFSLWKTGFRHWSLWIVIPFLMFNLGFGWYSISSLLGYAYTATPPADHQLLHFVVAKPDIYVLAKGPQNEPRLYKFDYSEETAKKLAEAGQQMRSGQQVMIKKNEKVFSDSELEFYNFELQKQYPKD